MSRATLFCGDAATVLSTLPAESVQCCVTSPPYWGLRDYSAAGQLGLESTPEAYLDRLVAIFDQVRRVLRKDGTLWVNVGDSYTDSGRGDDVGSTLEGTRRNQRESRRTRVRENSRTRLKPKDLLGMPWRVAFALQAAGWWLRADIIWAKPNPMPESVTDRPTKAHEYLFLLAKSRRYFYDAAAVAEPLSEGTYRRLTQATFDTQQGGEKDGLNPNRSHRRALEHLKVKTKPVAGWDTGPGSHSVLDHNQPSSNGRKFDDGGRLADHAGERHRPPDVAPRPSGNLERKFDAAVGRPESHLGRNVPWEDDGTQKRNARSVWAIATQPYAGAHFATFPEELARRCILAGSRPGDVVLDPFGGAGTVAFVATNHGRDSTYIDLNPDYVELARDRIGALLCDVA